VSHGGPPLRVLTWNLFHLRDGRRPPGPGWRTVLLGRPAEAGGYVHLNRKVLAEAAAIIRRAAPDLLLLQEVPPGSVAALGRAAGMHAAWAARTGPRVGPPGLRARLGRANPDLWSSHEGNANVVMVGGRLRPEPGSAWAVRLNTPDMVLRAVRELTLEWDAAEKWARELRVALLARVRPPGGPALTVACVHLHNARVPEQSTWELRRLAAVLATVEGPLVLGGDLNVLPGHPGLAALAHAGLTADAPAADPALGIDRILVRGLRVVRPERRWHPAERDVTVRGPRGPRLLRVSDHDPVEAAVAPPGATGS
jgi:endonuclease/exonuclease/phosphatase family metal-dependent hydrolase